MALLRPTPLIEITDLPPITLPPPVWSPPPSEEDRRIREYDTGSATGGIGSATGGIGGVGGGGVGVPPIPGASLPPPPVIPVIPPVTTPSIMPLTTPRIDYISDLERRRLEEQEQQVVIFPEEKEEIISKVAEGAKFYRKEAGSINLIYDDTGKLVGVEDILRGVSRLPTREEQITFGSAITPEVTVEPPSTEPIPSPYPEFYVPETEMFVSEPLTGPTGTAFLRPATPDELKRIEAERMAGAKILGIGPENILAADVFGAGASVRRYADLNKEVTEQVADLQKLEKGNVEGEVWTGSEEDYNKYSEKFREYERNLERIQGLGLRTDEEGAPYLTAGLFGYERKVPLTSQEILSLRRGDIGSQLAFVSFAGRKTIGGLMGGWYEEKARKVLGEKLFTTPSAVSYMEVPVTQQRQTIEYDLLTGEPKPTTQVITYKVPAKDWFTPEQVGKVAGAVGEFGPYAIPGVWWGEVGAKTVSSIQQAEGLGAGAIRMFKDYPMETLISAGALALKVGALGLRQYKGTYGQYETLKLTRKDIDPFTVAGKSYTWEMGGKQYTRFPEIKGAAQVVEEGRRIIVWKGHPRWKKRIKISAPTGKGLKRKVRFEILPPEPSGYLYAGIPYGKVGSKQYKKALKYFTEELGYSTKQAREILRLRPPRIIQQEFKGEGITVQGEELWFGLKGEEMTRFLKRPIKDIPGLKTRGGKIQIKEVDVGALPVGVTKEEMELIRGGAEIWKVGAKPGKRREVYDFFSGIKKTGEVELGLPTPVRGVRERVLFDIYKDVSVGRRTIPYKRKPLVTKGTVLVEKVEPKYIDLEKYGVEFLEGPKKVDVIGKGIKGITTFKGPGKKSRAQFLRQLYSPEEAKRILAAGLLKARTMAPVTPTKPIEPIIEEAPRVIARSRFWGTGLYERTGEVTVIPKPPPSVLGVTKFGAIEDKKFGTGLEGAWRLGTGLEDMQLGRQEAAQALGMAPLEVVRQDLLLSPLTLSLERAGIRERERVREGLRVATALRLAPRVTPRLRITTIPTVRPPPPPPPPPTRPPVAIPLIRAGPKKKKRIKFRKKEEIFIPYIRRYGEFVKVGKPTTFERALKEGIGKVRTTLAASLQIRRPTGEPVRIAKVTRKFRPGKDPFTLVQRAPFRLEARQEVAQIIRAREGIKWL